MNVHRTCSRLWGVLLSYTWLWMARQGALRVLVIQIQYNLDIASLLIAEGCWCKHQEGSKVCGLSRFYSWEAELERLWWCPTPSPPCQGTFFLIRLEFEGSWACRLRHWKPALWKCPYLIKKEGASFWCLNQWWMCGHVTVFLTANLFSQLRELVQFYKRICEVRIHLFKCVCKDAFVPKWSLGKLPLQPDAVCAWLHAVLPLQRATFGKWTLWVCFSPLKTSQVREKTKLFELTFVLCAEVCSVIRPLNHLP